MLFVRETFHIPHRLFFCSRREYAGSADNPEKETEYECRQCRDTGFITRMDENGREIACRCKCYEIRRSKERMRKSGISVELIASACKSHCQQVSDNLYPALLLTMN